MNARAFDLHARRRSARLLIPALTLALVLTGLPGSSPAGAAPTDTPERSVEPIVLTGTHLPEWSRLAAEGVADPHTSGMSNRSAHQGTIVVPPDVREGVPVDQITGFAWHDGAWNEIPVQVDERFPYFLANAPSDFSMYSGVDPELTYAWDIESWNKTAGQCETQYPEGESTMGDPVPTLDNDDEIVFMASDAGEQAPLDSAGPAGTTSTRQEVRLVDPRDPASQRFVYLFLRESGPKFDESNGYVSYERDDNADQWIDRHSFSAADPEKLGSSNTGYGPNLSGTVCDPDGTVRDSTDRFPRDGVTVSTDTYEWRASGRWMVRGMRVTKPGTKAQYGPDLIDRWKGRAFQQSPDSTISVVGFEDEQVNWEANAALLGELAGPVRAIREVWGADSGTNVTKTETFYRDAITYRYRVRVHPIPPDGLYTSWDYNHDQVSTYYNEMLVESRGDGVPIDGVNDEIVGNVDSAPLIGPAFFDAPDPTFTKPLAFFNWEQVSGNGDNGSLVYMFEMKNAQSLENPMVVPYYRDDACLDDGTGDDPSPRALPGESYEWMEQNQTTHSDAEVREAAREYLERPCYTEAPEGYDGPYRQGCFGCHGIHYFFTGDTDNAFSPAPLTEIDGQQWQWAVPTDEPTPVGDRYANTVKTPLVPVAASQASTPGDSEPDDPEPTSVAITGDTSGRVGDTVTLAAELADPNGPVAGKTISFSLDADQVGEAITNGDGVASLEVTLGGPARTTELTAAFAGDQDHAAGSATAPFEVERRSSAMDLSLAQQRGATVATATLSDGESGEALEGRPVTFYLNGEAIGVEETDGSGTAEVVIPPAQAKMGATVTAEFSGDDTHDYSSASRQISKR